MPASSSEPRTTLAPTMPTAAMSVPVHTTTGTSHSSAVSTTLVP